MSEEVSAWAEKITIPTYGIGRPEKNPIFLEKRVYQGSSGSVYPHPVIEKILDVKTDREYTAVFVENKYLRIMILPELGGRIQRAYDKIRQRDFIYYNQVIKPALVGLTGPWISGGIEFNWPQHHRPSTFEPVDFTIEENGDGSKTIWVNEVELMTRTKGMAGFTLYPGKAYLEIKARLYNRTFLPQTFLWWANPAVKVNDHYQSVFPPDVTAVFDHGKRDVSSFPIAQGTYYKVNYAPGTDISQYRNIPVPTSFMAVSSKYDFIGGYENDAQAGMLHVADHHVVPGKKQWTWGKSDFGIAWDRNLTDEDGPYIELMCGAFTDNQPDFSWLQPNEEKTFEQYFMPYARIGMVKNASKEAAVNLEVKGGISYIKVYATAAYPSSIIRLSAKGEKIVEFVFDLSPAAVFEGEAQTENIREHDLLLEVFDDNKILLISYQPELFTETETPPVATAAPAPADVPTNEELFLHGLHLEQYRHATFSAVDYYQEALRRDPGDIRCNNALGLWLLRKGQAAKAEPFFRRAIARATVRNPNPYDAEPCYNLGVSLKLQNRPDEAFDAFFKCIWNDAWQHSGFFQLARIAVRRGDFQQALSLTDKSLNRNHSSSSARHLRTIILRKLKKNEEALAFAHASLEKDKFNAGCLFEIDLIQNSDRALSDFKEIMRGSFNNYLEYAIDYAHAGLYDEAIALLRQFGNDKKENPLSPLLWYYLGYFSFRLNDRKAALDYFEKASLARPDFCFPGKIEDVQTLQCAIAENPGDAKAPYYLGNFWYANSQHDEAIQCWEQSIRLDDRFPTVLRNISLAYHNKLHDVPRSLAALQKAFDLDKTDARVLMELDQLYKLYNYPPAERLERLNLHLPLVMQRDDLYLERVTLYNQTGDYDTARELISQRQFHPWEGGEGKTVGQYLLAHLEMAKRALNQGQPDTALDLLESAATYPTNLGEGKLFGAQENDIFYLQGVAFEQKGMKQEAKEKFTRATTGITEPAQAIFYNDPQPDKIVYQGLAWLKLGNKETAGNIFKRLIEFGNEHMNDDIAIDYFAVSLPDLLVFDQDLNIRNRIHCSYLKGLGNLGLGNDQEAAKLFAAVLGMDINHQGAIVHNNMLKFIRSGQVLTTSH
jgi:tetratricopeptide (TPR) repeat protein